MFISRNHNEAVAEKIRKAPQAHLISASLIQVEESMEYIAKNPNGDLPNKPVLITNDNIRKMYEENLRDAYECERVTKSTQRGESYYANDGRPGNEKINHPRLALYKEILYRDVKTSGFIMNCPHGTVIMQGERESYYRGEKQIYPQSGTTLSRPLASLSSGEDRLLYRLVADMRIAEFDDFLRKFDRTHCWEENGLTVLSEPLAQHYGLETDWLDITNDFNVALFFANCYWDHNAKKWYPLTKKQTEVNAQTQYGVIFHAPAKSVMLENMIKGTSDCDEGMILPIGYQPFMRCHSQYGYGIHMKASIPLQNNPIFEILYFRHNEKLSRDIYELMDGGKKIYPEEGLDDFQDIIDLIIHTTVFSEASFLFALQKNNLSSQSGRYRLELEKSNICPTPICICSGQPPYKVSRQRVRRANRKDGGFSIEENYGIQLGTRYIYRPPSSVRT